LLRLLGNTVIIYTIDESPDPSTHAHTHTQRGRQTDRQIHGQAIRNAIRSPKGRSLKQFIVIQ